MPHHRLIINGVAMPQLYQSDAAARSAVLDWADKLGIEVGKQRLDVTLSLVLEPIVEVPAVATAEVPKAAE